MKDTLKINWTNFIKSTVVEEDIYNDFTYHYAKLLHNVLGSNRLLDKDFPNEEYKHRITELKPIVWEDGWFVVGFNPTTYAVTKTPVTVSYLTDRFGNRYTDLCARRYTNAVIAIVLTYFSDKDYLNTLTTRKDEDRFQSSVILQLVSAKYLLLANAITNTMEERDVSAGSYVFLNILGGEKRNYVVDTCQPCDGEVWDKVYFDDPLLKVLLNKHGSVNLTPHLYIRAV